MSERAAKVIEAAKKDERVLDGAGLYREDLAVAERSNMGRLTEIYREGLAAENLNNLYAAIGKAIAGDDPLKWLEEK